MKSEMPSKRALEWAAQLWCIPGTDDRTMDVEFATAIARQFDRAFVSHRHALELAQDALQWASGSPDFNVGGQARKGWLKVGPVALERVTEILHD